MRANSFFFRNFLCVWWFYKKKLAFTLSDYFTKVSWELWYLLHCQRPHKVWTIYNEDQLTLRVHISCYTKMFNNSISEYLVPSWQNEKSAYNLFIFLAGREVQAVQSQHHLLIKEVKKISHLYITELCLLRYHRMVWNILHCHY